MAYPISQEALDLFTTPYRQVVDISFYGLSDELHITDEDIVLGGFSVNRYSVSGSKIEIGSVVAAEIELKLNNADGRFNSVLFEGAEMYVRVGTKKWDAHRWENAKYHYVPFGYFTIDEAPRKLEIITLMALDRMVLFDKLVDMSLLSFPMTAGNLLNRICEICNVPLGTNANTLPNYSYAINEAPISGDLTYRQLLSWIAELTGTCGFIDWNGHLILKWYAQTDTTLTVKERFDSDIEENAVTITGVQVVAEEETFLEGDEGYVLNIESNELIQHDYQSVAQVLYSVLGGFSYTPFSATVKPMPHLYPLDIITFVDKNGIDHTTIITDYTFTLNMSTALEGKGETATRNGYASANSLTKRESAIINNLKKEQNKTLNNRIQAVLALNETIANSLGLYETAVEQADGSVITYFHNEPTLEESSIIYVRNAGGFAWTHDWNNGDPVWEYGFTQDGNAVYNALSAWKIQTQYLDAECVRTENISLEYRQSVQDNIDASATEVQQEFTVRLGELRSSITETLKDYSTTEKTMSIIQQTAESITLSVEAKITAETDRATAAELSLSSSITQTAESITAEVTRAKGAENALSSRITQTADSITSEITRAKTEEAKLSTKISQTFDNITLSVSETTSNSQTTSTFTLKNGSAVIDTASVTGTTAAQAATIAADAVNGITLSATSSGTSATLTMKNGNTTIDSATITFTGIVTFNDLSTKGNTTINGDNITTGTISADRIDVDSLYITAVYTTISNAQKSKQCIIYANGNTALFIGGDSSALTSNVTSTFIMGKSYVYIGTEYVTSGTGTNMKNLCFDTSNRVIRQNTNNYAWSLGNSSYPFESLYIKNAQLGNSNQGKVGFFGTNPISRQTVNAASTSSSTTASAVATSLNALITALKNYGLIS